MRLTDPASIDRAIEVVNHQAMLLGNTTVSGRGIEGVRDAWLDWWSATDAQLRTLFTDGTLADDLFRAQIDVQRLTEQGRPFQFVNSLNRLWRMRLDEVVAQLRSLKAVISRSGHILIVDTSALIEGEPLLKADWRGICRIADAERVRLVVPMVVVEELDDLKRDRNPRVMGRARETLVELWQLPMSTDLYGTVSATISIEVMRDSPWHARLPVHDEEIVDRASYLKDLCGRAVSLVAGDYAILLRARAAGLGAVPVGPVQRP